MVNEWEEVSLGDIFNVKHGFAFKGEFFVQEPTKTILVTPGNFVVGGGFKNPKPKYYNGPVPDEYVLKPGQVIVTMTDLSKESDTLGYPSLVPDDGNIWLHNQRVGLLEFKKVYLRSANMDNPNDNAAVSVIAYGLRPSNRNLNSEKTAIKSFKYVYGHNPVSSLAWDIVRAIAYSGATR